MKAHRWEPADRLFRQDRHWVGGDGAYSAQVGPDRVVWVFMDSLVCAEPDAGRGGLTFINNSVGIQDGLDPRTSSMEFFWHRQHDGTPASFFAPRGESYLWPGNVVVVDGVLVAFLMMVRHCAHVPASDPRHVASLSTFDVHDWVALAIDNPLDDPPEWRVVELTKPTTATARVMGTGGVYEYDGWVHCYGHADGATFLGRWSKERFLANDLTDVEWWGGPGAGWLPEGAGPPAIALAPAHTEFSVHRDDRAGRWVWVQIDGLWEGELAVRFADEPTGPWSSFERVLRPDESVRPDSFVYGGKAHPELSADGALALTYNNNAGDLTELVADPSLYWPQFVRLELP